MGKNVSIISFILIINFSTQAQFVSIPDANFRSTLKQYFPSCFNASDLMDTTCNAILGQYMLDVSGKSIVDLNGINYFKNLTSLACSNNNITSLPNFSIPLKSIYCSNNSITSLPSFMTGLEILNCFNNKISSISTIPAELKQLNISNNGIATLPTLPTSLTSLIIRYNLLNSLPTLPSSLISLDVNSNNISSLPSLPSTISFLECSHNTLSSLPLLPVSLDNFRCDYNVLTSLPVLPPNLKVLYCSNNLLQNLPAIPSGLLTLKCDNNNISCLPELPDYMQYLYIDQGEITCIPNIIISHPGLVLNIIDGTTYANIYLPICDQINDSNNCLISTSMQNEVFSSEIVIYPNPSNGIIKINMELNSFIQLEVYDNLGKVIILTKITPKEIFLEDKGIYFMKITTREGVINKKVVVE